MASPLRLSAEEKRVTFKISALSIGIAVLVAGFVSWLAFSGPKLEAGGLIAMIVVSTLILALLGLGIAGRWPGRMRTAASVEIAATPRQVFDTLRYAENEPYYRGIVRLVERLPEAGEVFRLHYFNTDACSECGLPKHPDLLVRRSQPGRNPRSERAKLLQAAGISEGCRDDWRVADGL